MGRYAGGRLVSGRYARVSTVEIQAGLAVATFTQPAEGGPGLDRDVSTGRGHYHLHIHHIHISLQSTASPETR